MTARATSGTIDERTFWRGVLRLPQWLIPSADTRRRVVVAALLGGTFSLILAAAARGRLIWAVDNIGIYSPQDFIYRPGVDVFIPSVASLLDGWNPYVTLYLSLAVEGAIAAYCAQLLAFQFARSRFHGAQLKSAEVACAVLYLGNPFILSFGNTSVLSNVLLSTDALLAIVAMLISVIRNGVAGVPVSRATAVWLGVAIGLASPVAFPNFLRLQFLIVLALLGTATYLFVAPLLLRGGRALRKVLFRTTALRFLVFTVPPSALLLAYPLWYTTSTFVLPKGVIGSIIASQPQLNEAQYNTLPYVVRLFGRVPFHTFAYSLNFQGYSLANFASWLWPLLAIGVPVVAVVVDPRRFIEWKAVAIAVTVACVAIAWSCATNPPLGFAIGLLVRVSPQLPGAIPYFYLEYQVLSWLYPLLAAVSIVWVGQVVYSSLRAQPATLSRRFAQPDGSGRSVTRLRRWQVPGIRRETALTAVVCVGIVLLLLCVDGPIVTGEALSASTNVSPGGFVIPSEYPQLRTELREDSGNTLLLPGIGSYFGTTWNFFGGSAFYSLYYYPSVVVVPAYFGPFAILNQSNSRSYADLTAPLIPSGPPKNDTARWPSSPYAVNSTANTLTYTWHPTKKTDDLSGQSWIGVNVTSNDTSLISQQITEGKVDFGILSLNATNATEFEWFHAEDGYNTNLTNTSHGFRLVALIETPYSGTISPQHIVGLRVWFRSPLSRSQISLSLSGVELWDSSTPASTWSRLMTHYGISTVLFDGTINHGMLEPLSYSLLLVVTLESMGLITTLWNSTDLSLYHVDLDASDS